MTDEAGSPRAADAAPLISKYSLPLRFLGFGLYWAWMSRFWIGSSHSPLGMTTIERTTMARIAVEAATAVALLLAALLASRLMRPGGDRILLLGGAVLGPLGTIVASLGRSEPTGVPLYLGLAWASLGIACACITLLWGRFYASVGLKRASLYTPLSLILGTALGLVITNMQPFAAIAITTLLPLMSVGMYLLVAAEVPPAEEQETPEHPRPLHVLWRIVLAIGVFGVTIGFCLNSRTLFDPTSPSPTVDTIVSFVVPLITLALLRKNSFGPTYRLTLPLTAAGFLLLPLLPTGASWVSAAIILAGSNFFDIFTWVAMADLSNRRNLSPIRVFGFGRAANQGGIALGWLISYLVTRTNLVGPSPLLGFSLTMVFVLILTTTLILNEGDLPNGKTAEDVALPQGPAEQRADEPRTGPGHWRQCCARIAAEYSLSPREEEVMVLLAKGHSVKHIQETLVITYHTAKSHANHIYKKLGVHSREELIELVERENCMGTGRAASKTEAGLATS